jgi:hypothetical protein
MVAPINMLKSIETTQSRRTLKGPAVIQYVNSDSDTSGKKSTSFTSRGSDGNSVNKKGAKKVHINPASKPDQMYRLLRKLIKPLIRLLKRWKLPFLSFFFVNAFA